MLIFLSLLISKGNLFVMEGFHLTVFDSLIQNEKVIIYNAKYYDFKTKKLKYNWSESVNFLSFYSLYSTN